MGRARYHLYAASGAVLVLGLAAAVGIYFGAGEEVSSATLDAIYGSKPYVRELQRFGGKASVIFDELMRWFGALWQGRRLAYTVGSISLVVSLTLYLVGKTKA